MLQIENTIVSLDVLEAQFVCNLRVCHGDCCVEGDAGAPLEQSEIHEIEQLLPLIMTDLSDAAKQIIEKHGVYYIDAEGEPVTQIVEGRECIFSYRDEQGICKCAIEKAYREGKTAFPKPVSCHLYPVRVQKYNNYQAVNYHRWHICKCAVVLGSELKVPVYRFLKEPLIRKFGEEWYTQLEIAAEEFALGRI